MTAKRTRLAHMLDRRALLRLAGGVSFERGEEYAEDGRVGPLVDDAEAGAIVAKVRGSADYRVRLSVGDEGLRGSCTCPMGSAGSFCKHCVAAGLVWLSRERPSDETGPRGRRGRPKAIDLRRLLTSFEKDDLIRLVFDAAEDDPEILERIRLRAARERSSGPELISEHRRAIDRAVRTGGHVAYRDTYAYADEINEQIRALEALLHGRRAVEVIELSEYFLDAIEQHLEDVDDSDGQVGECLRWLCELHLRACRQARPEPIALARRLLAAQLRSEYAFDDALTRYAEVLGDTGLAAYTAAAEEAWAQVRALAPREDKEERYGERGRLTRIMEALAKRSSDVERLVAVLARDLADEWSFAEIAKTYRVAGKHDRALEWAERGAAAFPGPRLNELLDILVDEYELRGRNNEAMALLWSAFETRPVLDRYQELAAHATPADWPDWRAKAFALLRERVAGEKRDRRTRYAWEGAADRSALVRVFIWEGDVLAAWREAQEGGCANELWLQLAERLEGDHPEKALPIYRAQVDPTVARMHPEEYARGATLVRKVRELLARLGRGQEFPAYLASVRAAHGRKRNFMRLLEGTDLGPATANDGVGSARDTVATPAGRPRSARERGRQRQVEHRS